LINVHDSVNDLDALKAVEESICVVLKCCRSIASELLYEGVGKLDVGTLSGSLLDGRNLLLHRFGNNRALGIHEKLAVEGSL
jgi:hypothetical protein